MRVFILCTGRCGSTSFAKACMKITNFTCAHESLTKKFGEARFDYPDNHIEADNRLSWHIGHLEKKYGSNAFYVHLKRNRDSVAKSYMRRFFQRSSIIDSFCEGIRMNPPEKLDRPSLLKACYDYVDTITHNIDLFLSNKENKMIIHVEKIQDQYPVFWKKIGAQGDLSTALKEFNTNHNSSSQKNMFLIKYRLKLAVMREWKYYRYHRGNHD